jgi:uncharacterized protein YgiM (DUF1202 family)
MYGYVMTQFLRADVLASAEAAAVPEKTVQDDGPGEFAQQGGALQPGPAWVQTASGAGNVYLRALTSTTSAIRDRIPSGTWLELIRVDGDWCRVRYNGQVGFVATEFVRSAPLADAAPISMPSAPEMAPDVVQVSASSALSSAAINEGTVRLASSSSSLNLRMSAVENAGVVAKAKHGEALEVLGYAAGGQWARVRAQAGVGYVSLEYVKLAYPLGVVRLSNPEDTLSLRRTAETGGAFLQALPNGAVVTLLERGAEWTRVRVEGGTEGFVAARYLGEV